MISSNLPAGKNVSKSNSQSNQYSYPLVVVRMGRSKNMTYWHMLPFVLVGKKEGHACAPRIHYLSSGSIGNRSSTAAKQPQISSSYFSCIGEMETRFNKGD